MLAAIPPNQAENTVIVFTADHGNYSGAHGFMTGKTGTLYDEAYHIPLVVADPSGRFTGETETPRTGLTSSVDVLPMLVSLGHGGSGWRSANLEALYGGRHDMLAMLTSAGTPGRDFVLLASDEVTPYQNASQKMHLLGLRTQNFKLGTYAQWRPGTTRVVRSSMETEFYDYSTSGGRLKIDNNPDDPGVLPALEQLLDDLSPNEHQAPLPIAYAQAQANAKAAYLAVA